jgi:hypothetical protein
MIQQTFKLKVNYLSIQSIFIFLTLAWHDNTLFKMVVHIPFILNGVFHFLYVFPDFIGIISLTA